MSGQIPPPGDVFTLVVVAWLAGLVVLAAVTRAWGQVAAGHFKVVWLVCAAMGGLVGLLHRPAWLVAAASALAFAAIYRKLDLPAGVVAAAASVGALVLAAPQSTLGLASGFAAALLLGAVSNAMLLGHWHLNQPRLGTGPLTRLVWFLWAGVATYAASSAWVAASGSGGDDGVGMVAGVTALAFVAFAGVLTAMVTHLVRTRSIMSATGILYLEILLCFVAVFTGSLGTLDVMGA